MISHLKTLLFWQKILKEVRALHYFSYHKIRSYGAPVMIIIAERGVGKSFGAKEIVVDEFLKKRSQFLYLRRYDNEIKELFEKTKGQKDFFQDLKKDRKSVV